MDEITKNWHFYRRELGQLKTRNLFGYIVERGNAMEATTFLALDRSSQLRFLVNTSKEISVISRDNRYYLTLVRLSSHSMHGRFHRQNEQYNSFTSISVKFHIPRYKHCSLYMCLHLRNSSDCIIKPTTNKIRRSIVELYKLKRMLLACFSD